MGALYLNIDLQDFCENYLSTYNDISLYFKNKNSITNPIAIATALFYTNTPNMKLIDKIHAQIESDNTLEPFKGSFEYIYSYVFSNYTDYENIIYDTIINIELFKAQNIKINEYITVTSFLLATKNIDDYDVYIDRTIKIYDYMKTVLNLELDSEDYIYAAIISILYRDLEDIFSELNYISYIIDIFSSRDIAKYMMYILIIKEMDVETKTSSLINLSKKLKAEGFNYSSKEEMSFLAFLSFIDHSDEEIIEILSYFSNFLDTPTCAIQIEKENKLLFTNILLCQYYFTENNVYKKNNSENLSSLFLAHFAIIFMIASHYKRFFG